MGRKGMNSLSMVLVPEKTRVPTVFFVCLFEILFVEQFVVKTSFINLK